jgi:hypothetical protein
MLIEKPMGVRCFAGSMHGGLRMSCSSVCMPLIGSGEAARDLEFRNQFGTRLRQRHATSPKDSDAIFRRNSASFLRIANGSLMETSNHLQDGADRGYSSQADVERLQTLARRSSAATTRLIRYLRTARPRA